MKLRCDMHKYDVQFYQTRMNMSRSIIRSSLTLHLLPILSSMYEHVPIYHLIVLDSTPSYTLCALTSHHHVRCSSGLKQLTKHHWHVTYTPCKAPQKAVEGATALFVCLFVLSSWMIGVRDKKHGTCLRNGRGCAAWALIYLLYGT